MILHRLLGTLLSMELPVDEKMNIIKTEYDILIEDSLRKDVSVMCNLSQGIREKGIAEGRAESEIEFIMNMHKKGYTSEQIVEIVEKSVREVEDVIQKIEPALV